MSTENTAQNTELNPFSIFDTNIEDIKSFDEGSERTDFSKIFYEPDPQDKPYVCAVKFLPNIHSPLNPLVKKFKYKLVHPATGKALHYDSPSTIGEQCMVLEEWSRLRNSENAQDQLQAKQYRRTRLKCAVVQIIRDLQKPELEGELRLFQIQYEGDIDNMIKSKMYPTKEELDIDPTLKAYNVFDPFGSPTLLVKAVKTENGRDFAGSKWNDTIQGMIVDGVGLTEADKGNQDKQKRIIELLQQEHININEHFAYKPADESRLQLVAQAIAKMSNGTAVVPTTAPSASNAPAQNATASEPAPAVANAPSVEVQAQSNDDLLNELGIG